MGKKIQIELVQSSSSEDEKSESVTQHQRHHEQMKRQLRKVTDRQKPDHVREHVVSEVQRMGKKKKKKKDKSKSKDESLVDFYESHPDMNRHQRMTLEGKLYRNVGSSTLPHSFKRLNQQHSQHFVEDEQAENWRGDADTITVEEFSTDLLRRKGAHYWITELMKRMELDPGSLAEIPNIAIEIIRNYPVVVFSAKGSKSGRQTSQMLEKMQEKHNLHKNVFLELVMDDSRAGTKTYNDLIMMTQMRGLPQIFIGETFIGGFDSLKKLNKFKKLGPMILDSLGFDTWPCKLCEKERRDTKKKNFVQNSREFEDRQFLKSHVYPGHI